MSKQTAKVENATNDNKLLLAIGAAGCIFTAMAAVLETLEVEGAMLLMIAYQLAIPVLCATLGTSREELYAVHPKAKDYDKLALILHQIQIFTWVFNCIDYYIGGEEIWPVSLCLCMLTNSIYILFISDRRKDRIAILGATLSGIAAINGMILDTTGFTELLWTTSLSFFLMFILPALAQRFQKRTSVSLDDVKFPE